MLKKIRILRQVISFINYLICLYGLYVFDFFSVIKISSFYKLVIILVVSLVILLFGVALTYLKKNSNIVYDVLYFITFLFISYNSKMNSDAVLFAILFTVTFGAIFSHYLYIFEKKIKKLREKEASDKEIHEVYARYIKILATFMMVVLFSFIVLSLIIHNLSSYLVMYLYSINMVFSIPAILGLVLLSLVGVFVLAPEKNDKK